MLIDPLGSPRSENEARPQMEHAVAPGLSGVRFTLRLMRRITREYKKSPVIREQTLAVIHSLSPKAWQSQVETIFRFVQSEIRYSLDINGVETVQTPDVTLALKAGDCDDISILLASMLESVGHPTRFVAVGYEPGSLEHVYVETLIGEVWVPLDATEPYEGGWAPPEPIERMIVHN